MFGGHESGDVFPDHIEFQVDFGAGDDGLDIGMLEGIGDDGDVKSVFFDVKDGEAGAIEADGAFFDDEVAEFFGNSKRNSQLPSRSRRLVQAAVAST